MKQQLERGMIFPSSPRQPMRMVSAIPKYEAAIKGTRQLEEASH